MRFLRRPLKWVRSHSLCPVTTEVRSRRTLWHDLGLPNTVKQDTTFVLTLTMDHNPLADRPPPRHAYESDSEDEDGPRPARGQRAAIPEVVVEWNPKPAPILTLLGAFGPVAKVWRKTIDLDPWQPVGKVIMADYTVRHKLFSLSSCISRASQVAYIYQRDSTIILISEQSTSIPTLLLTPFARQVLNTIKPSR